ncbi:MAG: hypothetical protein EOP43_04595, partial [Sphingobacteriaceae bacterium]
MLLNTPFINKICLPITFNLFKFLSALKTICIFNFTKKQIVFMHLDLFYNYLQHEKRYSENTLIAYQTDISQFFQFVETESNASFNDVFLIRNWVVYLMDNKHDSRSVNR